MTAIKLVVTEGVAAVLMKDDKPESTAQAEQDMLQVLKAERDAEQAIRNCQNETQRLINDVQIKVQRINAHADQRITNMEMRHAHKLNQLIRDIEKQGVAELGNNTGQHYDQERLQTVIEKLATELCLGINNAADDTGAGE